MTSTESTVLAARNLTRNRDIAARVEVAGSFWARFMGLMGRRALPEGSGLLLDGNGIHMFFMRFPIDAVFVTAEDGEGIRRVLAVHEALPPWTGMVPLVRGAASVIELPVGAIRASDTQVGDVLALETVAE